MELSRDKIKEIINDDWLLMDDCEGNKNCDVVKELARIALASLEAEPALYAAEETLAYANMGELHLTCLSEPMGDAVIPLYTAPSEPVSVPDDRAAFETFMEKRFKDCIDRRLVKNGDGEYFAWDMQVAWITWQGSTATLQAGNSPVIGIDLASGPDRTVEVRYVAPPGYVMVPKEPTEAMINAWLSEVANWRGHVAGYKAALAAAPQQEVRP